MSCKKCNKDKGDAIPEDYEEILLGNFKRAVYDKKINLGSQKINKQEFAALTEQVIRIEEISEFMVFQGIGNRLYIKNDTLHKIVRFGQESIENQ